GNQILEGSIDSSSEMKNVRVLKKPLLKILNECMSNKSFEDFRFPVDKELYPSYYESIKTPVDFQSIRNKVNDGQYDSATEFWHDLCLIYKNCMQYNLPGSAIYEKAVSFKKYVEELQLKYSNLSGDSVNVVDENTSEVSL